MEPLKLTQVMLQQVVY
ncbi:hypothetical protein Gorai_014024 [Gossypium raimondii]|uniref:Uncharacterized protein n=1 Tax=Gossypium raimondii TaxID=29730 RepID=A0A7J8P1S7_GOSRA|nr:hypothetical protein [Gossypium raimondii]